ncbi:MAG TPA: DUF3866 family protein [Solirubrobacteraceae bacterium]
MLSLRRGVVVTAADGPEQELIVELADGRHPAVADVSLTGRCEPGDTVIVNVEARELGLGSGGFDIVHVNLTRGLDGQGRPGADVIKLNYTSIQHAVIALETQAGADASAGRARAAGGAVGVIALHGQLAPLAWSLAQARPGLRLGYVQTAGGALPGSHSAVVRELRERGLLAAHVTAGPCYGGPDGDAITTIGAIDHGLASHVLDAVVCGPGPGIIGSGSTLGHGGMAALDSAHAALALDAPTLIVPRMSTGDRRPRHQGISHHSRTVLELVLAAVSVALPPGVDPPAWGERHTWLRGGADLAGYAASGLPASTMGRSLDADPVFFAVGLAAGEILAGTADQQRRNNGRH